MKQFLSAMVGLVVLMGAPQANAQSSELIVQREAAGLYLTHVVAPKENFYSIGRLYNISPKVIAPFNGLDLNGGLSVGQTIKIPLKDQNFTSAKQKLPQGEVLVPVYRMSDGKKLLAGYLKVVKGQSSLSGGGAPATSVAAVPVTAAGAPSVGATQTEAPPAPAPATAAKKPASKTKTPAAPPVAVVAVSKPDSPVASVETTAAAPAPSMVASMNTIHYAGEGAFHPDYLSQTDNGRKIRSTNGLAGVFKSTSGWDNGKFYALMNNVERGTVVKVTNLNNNKVVFVKILSDIADIKQNSGMLIVLSDAAVSQLGVGTDRFTAELTYGK
jgi:LysM repeat protein